VAGDGKNLGEGLPQAHRAVADDQFGVAHATAAAATQQVGPRLGRLPQPLGQGDQLLGSVQPDAEQDQHARVRLPQPDLGVHAVSPHVDEVAVGQVAGLEGDVVVGPLLSEPGDRRG
jgi:hypothetical protein